MPGGITRRCQTPFYQPLWTTRQRYKHSGALRHYIDYLDTRHALGFVPTPRQLVQLQRYGDAGLFFRFRHGLFGRRWTLYRIMLKGPEGWRLQQYQQQSELVRQFLQRLQRATSIAVVGNSPELKGRALAQQIDQAELVIRFNQAFSSVTSLLDTGKRTSYWMVAPDFNTTEPIRPELGLLVSGAEPLLRLHQLKPLQQLAAAAPVMQVPLTIWRDLYQQLQAPPSAGLLMLGWLRQQAIPAEKITLYGFSRTDASEQHHYHHALPHHQPSTRHQWAKEAALLRSWYPDKIDARHNR